MAPEAQVAIENLEAMETADIIRALEATNPVELRCPASTKTDCYSLGLTLKEIVSSKSRLHHTLDLMCAQKPEIRPDLDVVKIDFLSELHKNADKNLRQALVEHQCITLDPRTAKAICALLAGSTTTINLATELNIALVKEYAELARYLSIFYRILSVEHIDQGLTHGDYKSQVREAIRDLMVCEDKSPNSIKSIMQESMKKLGLAESLLDPYRLSDLNVTPFFSRSQEGQHASLHQVQAAKF
ncbi:hypothetical protein A0O36_01627 [Piscirickettsiaceae bacterium NZ-RLO1]|nr:hypothetical protein A0O36_01627 [Piscirickettsiaceae bacterium NZ-RLO1]